VIGPTDRKPPFKFSARTRVAFSDTDAQGIVYYGRYMPYFDQARVEYARHLGILGRSLDAVMRANVVEYFAPARFDDLIDVYVRVARIGTTSVTWACCAYEPSADRLLVTAQQTAVFIDLATHTAQPVPDGLRERLLKFEGSDLELAQPR
jgi:YbgC/YbaW family acyl-CoA thioester hydrolase